MRQSRKRNGLPRLKTLSLTSVKESWYKTPPLSTSQQERSKNVDLKERGKNLEVLEKMKGNSII